MDIIYSIILLKSVCQRSQTAGRNSRSIVSGDASCSVRPSNFFIREKLPKPQVNRVASLGVDMNGQRPALSQAERAVTVGWAPPNSDSLYGGDGGVCARVCARVCTRVCARACVRV